MREDISPGNDRPLGFGEFEVDRETRQLLKQGRRIRLQDQPFQVLCMLLDRAGSVVSREELRQALWPGSVYVDFDHGLNNAIARLREALSDNAASPVYIETLPRIGYRFIYPLPASSDEPAAPPAPASSPTAIGKSPARHATTWFVALVAALIVAGAWFALRDRAAPAGDASQPAVASIAVIPFASLSAEPEDSYFADGLSEELMTQLSRIGELRVAGVASSFRFKGGPETPAQVAEKLGVDHLLEGSIRRSGDRVRITTRLVEARTDRQIWAETFDRDFQDIFAIEDAIALAVTSALQVRLVDPDGKEVRRHGTRNAEAYRLYLMGMAQMRARGVRLDRDAARSKFEQAIALDPGFTSAHAALAGYHFNDVASRYGTPEESWRAGLAAAERAIALGPGNADALRVMADFEMLRYRYRGEGAAYGRSTALFERSTQAEPNSAYTQFDFGRAIQWSEPRRALAYFDRADELDPLVPVASGLGVLALDRLGMTDAADLRLRSFVARSGESYSSRVVAALDAYRGRLDEAAAALAGTRAPYSLDLVARLQLTGIYRSLGDAEVTLAAWNQAGTDPLTDTLRRAAVFDAAGNPRGAFTLLDANRRDYPETRMLDLPAARFALLAGQPARAASILAERLPDLANGSEAVTATRVLPGLDLVLAWSRSGRTADADALRVRIEKFLDGAESPQLPLFTVQRARAHALAGRTEDARATLERAFAQGFRMTCHLDLQPQPLLYIDCIEADPAFDALRRDGSFQRWLARIAEANSAQRAALRQRAASDAAT